MWAVRFLADAHTPDDTAGWSQFGSKLIELADKESSGLVLLYLASAQQRMPNDLRWSIGQAIGSRNESDFSEDRTLAIMLWLGIEPIVPTQPDKSLELLKRTSFTLVRENIARRLAEEIDRNIHPVEQLFDIAAEERRLKTDILRGFAAALDGRKNPPVPANWSSLSEKLAAGNSDAIDSLNTIGIAFADPRTIATLRKTVQNSGIDSKSRIRALQLLLTSHPTDFGGTLRQLVKDPDLAAEAIRGLAAYEDNETPTTLLDNFTHFSTEERVAALNTLASRVNYARILIQALDSKQLRASDISAVQARQLMALGDPAISQRLRSIWGDSRQTSGEKRKQINNLKAILTPVLTEADVGNGKALFTKTCATCHTLFGQGAKIGPELTGSNRKNLDYLLENIVDPSAVVAAEFRVTTFVLNDGRVLNGIIREQNDKTILIETPESKQVIDRSLIDETNVSDKSLMPDGLLQTLDSTQIRDLIAYLMSDG